MAEAAARSGAGPEGVQSYAKRLDMSSTDIARIPLRSLAGTNSTTVVQHVTLAHVEDSAGTII